MFHVIWLAVDLVDYGFFDLELELELELELDCDLDLELDCDLDSELVLNEDWRIGLKQILAFSCHPFSQI